MHKSLDTQSLEAGLAQNAEYAAFSRIRETPYAPDQYVGAAQCSDSVFLGTVIAAQPAAAQGQKALSGGVPGHRQHLLGGRRVWLLSDHDAARAHSARYGFERNARCDRLEREEARFQSRGHQNHDLQPRALGSCSGPCGHEEADGRAGGGARRRRCRAGSRSGQFGRRVSRHDRRARSPPAIVVP